MPVLDETLTWKGAWAAGVDYVIDDAVLDGGLVYVCNADNTSDLTNRPPDAGFWDLLVETPLADSYASVELYRALIQSSSDADDSLITDDLRATTRMIDKRIGRTFAKDAAPVARIFAPALDRMRSRSRGLSSMSRADWAESENPYLASGMRRVLRVDDLVSVSSIEIDHGLDNTFSQTLTTNDYELTPRNNSLLPEPEPYTMVELTEWGSVFAFTPAARVRITGIWGWPAVPEAIVRACVQLTAILRLESPRATRVTDELGQTTGMSRDGAGIVDELMRHYVKVGV